jgi:hypothetical protein
MAAEELSIDDELRAEYKRIYEGKTDEPEPTPDPEPAPAETQAELPLDEPAPRAPDGKFLSRTKQEPPAQAKATTAPADPPATPAEVPPTADAQPGALAPPADAPARDINRAPSSWKPAAKATWDKLPPEIRAEVHRREADFLKGQSSLLPDAEMGRTLRQVIEPYRMLIDSEGSTAEKAIGELFRTASILRMGTPQQKFQTLSAIAQQYGIQPPQGQQTPPPADPNQPAPNYDPRVDGLMRQLQQQQLQQQQEQQQRASAAQREVESVATAWIAEADPTGKPLRPYLDNVMDGMNVRVPQIRASNPSLSHKEVLQTAYEQEIWAHPEIRPILLKEQQEAAQARSRTENQERVNLARKATSVNVPRRGSSLAPAKPGTIDDTIRETARALGMITSQ